MALQGNCIYYEIVDTGETEEVNVTHPDGVEEVINTPKMEEVAHEYNDIYVVIQKIDTFHQYETTDEGVQKHTIVLFSRKYFMEQQYLLIAMQSF